MAGRVCGPAGDDVDRRPRRVVVESEAAQQQGVDDGVAVHRREVDEVGVRRGRRDDMLRQPGLARAARADQGQEAVDGRAHRRTRASSSSRPTSRSSGGSGAGAVSVGRREQGRVLVQESTVQRLELGGRVDAELVGQRSDEPGE